MENLLHLEVEHVYFCSIQLRQQSTFFREQARSLAVLARSVEWLGANRDTFQNELERIAILIDRMADEENAMAAKLIDTIERWGRLDQRYRVLYSHSRPRLLLSD